MPVVAEPPPQFRKINHCKAGGKKTTGLVSDDEAGLFRVVALGISRFVLVGIRRLAA